jgi:hypothetical protein
MSTNQRVTLWRRCNATTHISVSFPNKYAHTWVTIDFSIYSDTLYSILSYLLLPTLRSCHNLSLKFVHLRSYATQNTTIYIQIDRSNEDFSGTAIKVSNCLFAWRCVFKIFNFDSSFETTRSRPNLSITAIIIITS